MVGATGGGWAVTEIETGSGRDTRARHAHGSDEHRPAGPGHAGERHDGHSHDSPGHDSHGHGADRDGADGHGHEGHGHGVTAQTDRRWLSLALLLIGTFMLGEVVVGVLARSLALISDAAHMLTDAGAILLALIAMRLAARPPRGGYTFGLRRAEILSAQANGITMLLLGAFLGYEAIRRLVHSSPVAGGLVLGTALVGVAVNAVASWALSRANRASLNIQGAFQHILNDLYAFAATVIAGLVILLTGWNRADAVATLFVVALMLRSGVRLVGQSGRIFLEAAPSGTDPAALGAELAGLPGVAEVHDLHVWQITSGDPALSAHVLVAGAADCHAVRVQIEQLLRARYRITHTTLQVDHTLQGEHPDEIEAGPSGSPSPDGHCSDPHGAVYRPGDFDTRPTPPRG
jgi:cobalt-zinc-cadmium efflux system protein